MAKKEVFRDPQKYAWLYEKYEGARHNRLPETEMQALVQAAPHSEPQVSKQEREALREIVVSVMDELSDEETWFINALLFERLSLRTVEYITGIPKTSVARKRDKILAKLRNKLADNPAVKEYINGDSTSY